jgi:hypothetical protein
MPVKHSVRQLRGKIFAKQINVEEMLIKGCLYTMPGHFLAGHFYVFEYISKA